MRYDSIIYGLSYQFDFIIANNPMKVKKLRKKEVAKSVVKENQQEKKVIHHFSYADGIYIWLIRNG